MDKLNELPIWLLALLVPVQAVMVTMVFLIIVDLITGIYASFKTKQKIEFKRISHTLTKIIMYNLVILASYFLEENILNEIPFLRIIAGFIALTEIKSILKNFDAIYGVNPFKAVADFMKKKKQEISRNVEK